MSQRTSNTWRIPRTEKSPSHGSGHGKQSPHQVSSRGDEIAIFIGTKTDGILRFSLTPQHVDGSAAVAIDGISQKCRVTEVKKKFQVQATDRSFQDVRRKSVRLAEAVKQTKSNNSEELQKAVAARRSLRNSREAAEKVSEKPKMPEKAPEAPLREQKLYTCINTRKLATRKTEPIPLRAIVPPAGLGYRAKSPEVFFGPRVSAASKPQPPEPSKIEQPDVVHSALMIKMIEYTKDTSRRGPPKAPLLPLPSSSGLGNNVNTPVKPNDDMKRRRELEDRLPQASSRRDRRRSPERGRGGRYAQPTWSSGKNDHRVEMSPPRKRRRMCKSPLRSRSPLRDHRRSSHDRPSADRSHVYGALEDVKKDFKSGNSSVERCSTLRNSKPPRSPRRTRSPLRSSRGHEEEPKFLKKLIKQEPSSPIKAPARSTEAPVAKKDQAKPHPSMKAEDLGLREDGELSGSETQSRTSTTTAASTVNWDEEIAKLSGPEVMDVLVGSCLPRLINGFEFRVQGEEKWQPAANFPAERNKAATKPKNDEKAPKPTTKEPQHVDPDEYQKLREKMEKLQREFFELKSKLDQVPGNAPPQRGAR
ncbi:hypothetical protein L596_021559 [Steinernema carpocapsae]|uniref:Uncharacterized protein n=1 Tax=Steinernema carpocapsae TaxID=34508 RepID=A0A4U5MJ70_STECR|nr:hypothetical protein L596_021559 [Steinernema carpocapsae]